MFQNFGLRFINLMYIINKGALKRNFALPREDYLFGHKSETQLIPKAAIASLLQGK